MEYAILVLMRKVQEIDSILIQIDELCTDFYELQRRRHALELAIYLLQQHIIAEIQTIDEL